MSSTTETWAVEPEVGRLSEPVALDLLEEGVPVALEVGRSVVDPQPVPEDGALDADDLVDREAGAGELGEHDGQDRATDRGRRVRRERPRAGVETQGGADARLVGLQVRQGQQALAVLEVGGDGPGEVPVVEVTPAGLGEVLQAAGQGRVGDGGARPEGYAVAQEEGGGRGVPGEEGVAGEGEVAGGGGAEREPGAGARDRGGEDVAPGKPPAALVGGAQAGEGAGGRDAAGAGEEGEATAVRRRDLAAGPGRSARAGGRGRASRRCRRRRLGSASSGQTVTKAPPSGLTTPGSVDMATTIAATAASTAPPPAAGDVEAGLHGERVRGGDGCGHGAILAHGSARSPARPSSGRVARLSCAGGRRAGGRPRGGGAGPASGAGPGSGAGAWSARTRGAGPWAGRAVRWTGRCVRWAS